MSRNDDSERFSLKRWSRLKQEAAGEQSNTSSADDTDELHRDPIPHPPFLSKGVRRDVTPGAGSLPIQREGQGGDGSVDATLLAPAALPPVESLTFDSNFSVFMQKEVDPGLRREAMKKLFRDPHFNVMDGLDVYIDDYTQADPIPPAMLARLQDIARKWEGSGGQDEPTTAAAGEPPASVAAASDEPSAVGETPHSDSPTTKS